MIELKQVTKQYGQAAVAAVICVFTPIAALRGILAAFFRLVMINSNAVLHIGVCLLLSAALSFAGLEVLKRKSL